MDQLQGFALYWGNGGMGAVTQKNPSLENREGLG
jgi:hypothetical protein